MLPLMYKVKRSAIGDPFIPCIVDNKEQWLLVLDDIIFALEYYIYEKYEFNPIRYKKLKRKFQKEHGLWHTQKIKNFKRKPCRDIVQSLFKNHDYTTDYDILENHEKRANKGFNYIGKYFHFLDA